MASQFSQPLLGKPLEGIWHTGIVCYGKEFYFGAGITADNPGQTPFGTPTEVVELGTSQVPVRTPYPRTPCAPCNEGLILPSGTRALGEGL